MTSLEAWQDISSFCGDIASLVDNDDVSEVCCNPDGSVFIESAGVMRNISYVHLSDEMRQDFALRVVRAQGQDISDVNPLYDGWLPNGPRISIVCPPISTGWCFSIRKFPSHPYSIDDLKAKGMMTEWMFYVLCNAVRERKNILVSGATSAGKTSLVNALCGIMPVDQRVVVIEDTSELKLAIPNLVRFEARPAQDHTEAVTIRSLVKKALRFRPDRIIVGEVRGEEAFDLLRALTSGHAGSLSTVHSENAIEALHTLAMYAALAKLEVAEAALKSLISKAVHMVVQLNRVDGKRIVSQIVQVDGYQRETDAFLFTDLTAKADREGGRK